MDVSVDKHRVHFEEYCRNKLSEPKAEHNTSKTIWKEKGKAYSDNEFFN